MNATRLPLIAGCRADLARLSDGVPRASSWLFCACGEAITRNVADDLAAPMLSVLIAAACGLSLALTVLCFACKGAGKAKKRRKQQKLEKQQLRAAERESEMRTGGGAEMMHGTSYSCE